MDQSSANLIGKPSAANFAMENTGERMLPGQADARTFWEHIYRYRFATGFVRGKRVLDIACGEGYGTAALQKSGALNVIGVDISEEACAHARKKYGIETRLGSAEAIPLEDASVEVVVSFETIEHVPHPEIFLDECRRVLRPGGSLVISTPNREAYRQMSPNNTFHCAELSHEEFVGICAKRFDSVQYFSQRPISTGRWSLRGMAMPYKSTQVPGIKARLGWALQPRLCPNLSTAATEYYGDHPIEAIMSRPRCFSSMVDPYAIRKYVSATSECPIFTLAVAKRT